VDRERFDALTRALATGTSRRRALKGAIGGGAGAVLAAIGFGRASAQLGGCAGYGRICRVSGCCTTLGAECRCYPNGHCRCVCPTGTAFDAATGACSCPEAGTERCNAGSFGCGSASSAGLCCPPGSSQFVCCSATTEFAGCCTAGDDCPGDANGPTCSSAGQGACVS